MEVETFEAVETMSDGTVECDEQAIALIEEMGLDGQQSLLRGGGETKTRTPYRKMTDDEVFVYETLMGEKTPIGDYSDGPIPLRVLQIASHAKPLYDRLMVWHATNADVKDPVLVGVNGTTYSDNERFILARWGDALQPIEVLRKMALKLKRNIVTAQLKEIQHKVAARIAALESLDEDHLSPALLTDPSYYE